VRPLKVKIKGFTAFADEIDLDFAGLDLFAITGPTGAGKTSLVQAIPIALYGRAPKVADDLRQLISPSAEHARFHCEFMARGGRYRITRVIHRTRPTAVALEEHVNGDEWRSLARGVRQATERVEGLLGLDYDTFTRVVLLPQNEFDAFLRGKPDERRTILTRLLSLEIYGRIQQRANQLAAAARTEVEVLSSILERDYADATPEHLAEVRNALAQAEREAEVQAASVEALERGRALAVAVRQARRDWTQASETLAELQGNLAEAREEHFATEDAVRTGLNGLQAIEHTLAGIAYDTDRHLALMRAQEQAARFAVVHRRLGELAAVDAASKHVLAQLTRRRDEGRRTFDEAEQSLARAQALETNARRDRHAIQHRVGTRASIAALIQREHQYRDDLRHAGEVETAIAALGERQRDLAERLAERHAALREARQGLEKVQQRRTTAARTVETLRTTEGPIHAIASNLAAARLRVARARDDRETAERAAGDKRGMLATAEKRQVSAQTALLSAQDRLAALHRAHAAHELQNTLAAGKPCPVCDQTVLTVPALKPVPDLDDTQQRVKGARAEADAADRALRLAAGDLAAADQAVSSFTAGLGEAEGEVERLGREFRDLLPADLRDEADWRARLRARVERAAQHLGDAERSVTSAQDIVTATSSDAAGIEAEVCTIPRQLEERGQVLRSLHGRCREAELALRKVLGDRPGPDAGTRLAAIDVELQAAETETERAAAAVHEAQQILHDTRVLRTETEQRLAAETERGQAGQEERQRLLGERLTLETALAPVVRGIDDVAAAVERELAGLVDAKTARETLLRQQEERHGRRPRPGSSWPDSRRRSPRWRRTSSSSRRARRRSRTSSARTSPGSRRPRAERGGSFLMARATSRNGSRRCSRARSGLTTRPCAST
jgi:exonuclease SbcC